MTRAQTILTALFFGVAASVAQPASAQLGKLGNDAARVIGIAVAGAIDAGHQNGRRRCRSAR